MYHWGFTMASATLSWLMAMDPTSMASSFRRRVSRSVSLAWPSM